MMTSQKTLLKGFALFALAIWVSVGVVAYCNRPHKAPERQGVTVPSFDYPMDKPTNIDLDTDDAGVGE